MPFSCWTIDHAFLEGTGAQGREKGQAGREATEYTGGDNWPFSSSAPNGREVLERVQLAWWYNVLTRVVRSVLRVPHTSRELKEKRGHEIGK